MQKHLEGRFERNDHADTPDGHSSLASALVVTTLGVRRAKEEGTAARHAGDIELASAPAPQAMRESAASDVHCNLRSALRPACRSKVGPVFETGQRRAARLFCTVGASSRRRGNSWEANLLRARGSTALGRVRVSYCSCRSRRAVPAQVVVELSQLQQRRGLASHSSRLLRMSARTAGKKEGEKARGEIARSCKAQAHRKMKMRVYDSWSWMVVLAGIQ